MTPSVNREKSGLKKIITYGSIIVIVGLTLSSYYVALNAFISPTTELRWDGIINYINDVSFTPGDTVTISGFLEEGEQYWGIGTYHFFTNTETIRWIIVVKDPNNMPIYLETGEEVDALGDITIDETSFNLPPTAAPGTYTIRMLIWTDILPSGVSRTNEVQEITFEVV